jgi:hypothetical protein
MTSDSNPPNGALEALIEQLLERLAVLHAQIEERQKELASREKELEEADKEYRNVMAGRYRKRKKLHDDIDDLQAKRQKQNETYDGETDPGSAIAPGPERSDAGGQSIADLLSRSRQDDEARRKDELIEFVTWAQGGRAGGLLLKRLEDMYRDHSKTLADMLEIVPLSLWGKEVKPERGNLELRRKRLEEWEKALSGRLARLDQAETRYKNDPRYPYWVEWRRGLVAWHAFLDREKARLQGQINRLRAELERAEANPRLT